jgi:response regulator RpfG family c-di-GMP phosphodiesterase
MSEPMILLVDDNADMLDAVRRTIAQPPREVFATTDPFEAADMLGKSDFHLVISDLQMPGLNGHEVLRRAKYACPDAVRIMLTGVDDIAEVKRAINESEVHRFISKPFEPAELRAAVAGAIAFRKELVERQRATLDATKRLETVRQIESESPGLTVVHRNEAGSYVIDSDRVRRAGKAMHLGRFCHAL